jgi:hypothetical protein
MQTSTATPNMRRLRRGFVLAALAVVAWAPSRDARADPYKDEKKGFSINAPRKWKSLPIAPDEKFVAASFNSDREWEVSDAKTSSFERHRPQIDVVILAKSDTEKKAGGVTVEGSSVTISGGAEYKDFKDYLDKTTQRFGGGGFFFSKEEEQKVGGVKVMFYEVTIDKLANAPKKRWGWAFFAEDAVYGVVGDALIKFEDKVRPDIEAAARSFKLFAHSAALGSAGTGESGGVTIRDPSKKTTPEERKKERDDAFAAYVARVKETLPDGWKIKETPHFVVVSHCDDKFTKEMVDHAEALRGWLDESLGYFGENVPGRTVLRLCQDQAERDSMMKSGGWTSYRFEVTAYKDREHTVDSRLWGLNGDIWRRWLADKNSDLRGRLPVWITYGLSDTITTAISKGKRIEFKASGNDNERIATIRRADKLLTAKDFLTKGTPALNEAENTRLQLECFARFMLCGGSQANAKYKGLLAEYVKNFVATAKEESEKENPAGERAEAQTEEEENAQFRARENAWKERELEILKGLLEKTFPGWTDKEWGSFNNCYWKDLGV